MSWQEKRAFMKCGYAVINGKHFDPQKLGRCAICGRKAVVEEAPKETSK